MQGKGDLVLYVTVNTAELSREFCDGLAMEHHLFPDEVIDAIIDRATFSSAWTFFKRTGRGHNRMARRFLKEKLPLQALDTLDETCDQDTFEEVLSYPYDIFDLSLEQLIEKMDITRKKGYKCGPKVLLNVLTLLSKCNLGKMYSSYMQSLFFDMIREHPMLVAKQEFSQVVLDNNLDNSMFIKQLICKEAFTLNGMVDPELLISTCGCKVDRYGWRETLHLLLEMVEPERAYQSALDAATGDEVAFSIIREAMHAKVIVDPTEALLFTCSRDILAKKELLASGLKAGLLKLNDYIISQMIPIMDAEAVMLFELACKGSYPLPESLRSVLDMQCNIGVTLLFEAWCNLEKADKETCLKLAERLTAEVLPREALFILNTHLKFDKSPEVAEAVKAASEMEATVASLFDERRHYPYCVTEHG